MAGVDTEALAELLADLDRDPDGYLSKSTLAALMRATWSTAPPGPDDGAPCSCGCCRPDGECAFEGEQ